jgi:hypothetical protein
MLSTTKRGRKSTLSTLDPNKKIVLRQHHFNYSDEFAEKLAYFATAHLDDKNKAFKTAWNTWKDENSSMIENEITKITEAGYQGSVEEKMYFSARYYYRKKAIREQNLPPDDEKTPRKKYECIDKNVLIQMNEHILSQIESSIHESHQNGNVISSMTPSKSFADYCKMFGICEDDANIKKKYKNLYWRISKNTKA